MCILERSKSVVCRTMIYRVARGLLRNFFEPSNKKNRKCEASKAMLYIYSWLAEAFCKSHGYREFGRFDFPEGPYRIDMQKSL